MGKNRRVTLLLTVFFLVLALGLSMGTAYARYRDEISGDQTFEVKPLAQLTIANQHWQQVDNGYALTFSMAQEAQGCRVYLAVSDGVTAPQTLNVTLTLPVEAAEGEVAAEPVVLTAKMEQIPESSAMSLLFGPGYVFRFWDEETGKEVVLDLSTEEYTLTVEGLDSAAQQASLLRLFVEYVQN